MKKNKKSLLSSPFFKIGLIGIVGLIIIIIVGAILKGSGDKVVKRSIALKWHLENTAAVISDYQKNVKSSDLRSSSASLYSILTNTDREITDFFSTKGIEQNDKDIIAQANLEKDGLETDLFEAKINGILDRVYALKMAYEISTLMTEETDIYHAASDDNLKKILESSYSSLDTLYGKFNSFSETK